MGWLAGTVVATPPPGRTETRGAEATGLSGRQNTSVVSQWSVACNLILSFTC